MPLVILLRQTNQTFLKGAGTLSGWRELSFLEMLIIRRMRTAFLVHWYGRDIPTTGAHLRVAIANLDALRARYQMLDRLQGRRTATPQMNLTEPLMGLVGAVGGLASVPAVAVVLAVIVGRLLQAHSEVMAFILGQIPLAGTVFGLIGGGFISGAILVAGPLLALGVPAMAMQHPRTAQRLVTFLGATAELIDAAVAFVDQILGPRSAVRNPLLWRMLVLFDHVGQLLVQLVGAAAYLVVRVGALLQPLIQQIPQLFELVVLVAETIAFILEDVLDRILWLVDADDGPLGAIRRAQHVLTEFVQIVGMALSIMFADYVGRLQDGWRDARTALQGWWAAIQSEGMAYVRGLPVIRLAEEAIDVIGLAVDVLRQPSRGTSSGSSGGMLSNPFVQEVINRASEAVIGTAIGTPPSVPDQPDTSVLRWQAGLAVLPSLSGQTVRVGGVLRQIGRAVAPGRFPNPFAALAPTREEIDALTRVPSVFAAERQRLTGGRRMKDMMAALRAQEMPYRLRLQQIVSHVLPTRIAVYVVELDDLFRAIDENVYGIRSAKRDFEAPVRALLESRRLQPVVRRLRVAAPGGDDTVVRTWTEELQRQLQEQPYLAAE